MTINEAINHDNASLVDVRTHEEVAMESVPGATHIPLDEIPVRWEEFKSMSRPLVLFCPVSKIYTYSYPIHSPIINLYAVGH